MTEGKFIVLYGINNLGKTTQAKKLVVALQQKGFQAEYLKYPQYEIEPFGPILNAYLRQGNPQQLSAREFQLIHLLDKLNFEKTLISKLKQGIMVITEDYKGTSLAWGMGAGVDENWLKKTNQVLLKEDLVFLFDGERFMNSVEEGHKHEQNTELMDHVRKAHIKLGQEYGWIMINANKTLEEIHQIIMDQVIDFLSS